MSQRYEDLIALVNGATSGKIQRPQDSAEFAWILYGAGLGGLIHNILSYIEEDADNLKLLDRTIALNWAVKGFARAGHTNFVLDFIHMGASVEVAVYSAAIGSQDECLDILLEKFNSVIPLNVKVKCFAAAGRINPMNELLIVQGASRDDALQGAAAGGHENVINELFAVEDKETMLNKPFLIGLWDNGLEFRPELDARRKKLVTSVSPEHEQIFEAELMSAIKNGYRSPMCEFSELYVKNHRLAFIHALASAGFRTQIRTLLLPKIDNFKAALEGAAEADDRDFISELLGLIHLKPGQSCESLEKYSSIVLRGDNHQFTPNERRDGMVRLFVGAKQSGNSDLFNWLFQAIDQYALVPTIPISTAIARTAINDFDRETAIQFLAKIDDDTRVKEITKKTSIEFPVVSLVRKAKVTSDAAIAFRRCPVVLSHLFSEDVEQENPHGPRLLPRDIIKAILVLSGHLPDKTVTVDDLKRMVVAARAAASLNMPTPEEWACIQEILGEMRPQRRYQEKIERIEQANDLSSYTAAFCFHRNKTLKRSQLLPKSMGQMMLVSNRYQNLTALSHWLNKCFLHMEKAHNSKKPKEVIRTWAKQIEFRFPPNRITCTSDPKELVAVLRKPIVGDESLEDFLSPTPYWQDLLKRFPLIKAELEANHFMLSIMY